MGEWLMDVIRFQKIFRLCGVKGQIVEIRLGVSLRTDAGRLVHEDRARILETEFAKIVKVFIGMG